MTTAFIQGVGPLELGIVLLIVLVLVGRSRLPQLGRQLGDGMREFKDSVSRRADKHFDGEGETDAPAALGSPTSGGEETPVVDGEVVRERS